MTTISYTEMLLAFVFLVFVYHWIRDRKSIFIEWPIIGSLPVLLCNLPHLHDYVSKFCRQIGGTFEFRGPWFCKMDYLVTCDPMNTNHILSKKSSNYIKGPDFSKYFEPYGDGIFTADSDSWKFQRKMINLYLKDSKFQPFLERTIQEKVANSLFPVLDHACISKMEVNLGDVLLRLGFDIVSLLFLGHDSKCLSVELSPVNYNKAMNDVLEAVVHRHVVPEKYWKLQKWLHIGQEKKLSEGLKMFDDFVYQCISSNQEKHFQSKTKLEDKETNFNFLLTCLSEEAGAHVKFDCKFVRDVSSNLVFAGRDTSSVALSWFFWLLASNQSVETKILQEIKDNIKHKHIYSAEELNKLTYLHAALCETLRLYPPVPMNLKCSVIQDTLPSGHLVKENAKIFISYYAMGRMERIWGNDCCEFKPERWISEDGGIMHVPSYKFTAFSAGPRTCSGKDTSFVQMKIVAVSILTNYRLQLIDDRPVVPSTSVVLHMKHGFKVRITKRSI